MSLHKTPLEVRPPYPDTTPPEEPYSPSLLQSPAFDLTDLTQAQQAQKMNRSPSTSSEATASGSGGGGVVLPDSLRIGSESSGAHSPTRSKDMWRGFQKDEVDIPESLRPGGGIVRTEAPAKSEYTQETDPEMNPWAKEKERIHEQETDARPERGLGTLPPALFSGGEKVAQNALPAGFSSSVWEEEGDVKSPPSDAMSPESDASSPLLMTANLRSSDRPFSEFSPFYNPPTPFTPSPVPTPSSVPVSNPNLPASLSHLEISPRRPSIIATSSSSSELKGRQHSIASSISSVFEPGVDMSSFDASTTRAFPGRRGYPAVGMDGWKEDEAEDEVAKTWEEELDRRAKAGAELQRRTEAAAEREREERLQAEFWEEERRLGALPVAEGPQKPPKPELPPRQPTPEPRQSTPPLPPLPARQPPPSATTTTEIYQIKHITWLPPTAKRSSRELRFSPILLQAANGPCPLLALVNALILSTPAGTNTALLSTLKAREQVSLELLLDAVFQELMDRGGAAGLQDVGDLFAFLLTLHTGMNVNPRFYPSESPESPEYAGFESTREMELYGAFKIRLVHGWLPEPNHPVIPALKRRKIANYEDAQTLLFTEEEIINRITTAGATLGPGEGQIIEDAAIIREFMDSSKTQLTQYGLDEVRSSLKPGDVAILFRNDHFMTVIGGRDATALHGLVTDAGFATHEEVVWETMVDVQGRANTFLSGDFRPVGGAQQQQQQQQQQQPRRPVQSLLGPDEGWEPIPESIRSEGQPSTGVNDTDHDADLALAMMLQEEEDERHRRSLEAAQRARRQQPPHTSPPHTSPPQQPRTSTRHPPPPALPLAAPPPPTPPRTTGTEVHTHRPADANETAPPPPYERVPSTPTRPAATTYTQRENMSAYQSMSQQQPQQPWAGEGARHNRSVSAGPGAGPLSSAQRQQAARGLLQEIAGSGAAAGSGARRGSGGAQGGQSGQGPQQGRRQSISGHEDGKEKCVIC